MARKLIDLMPVVAVRRLDLDRRKTDRLVAAGENRTWATAQAVLGRGRRRAPVRPNAVDGAWPRIQGLRRAVRAATRTRT
jgi:hypothetical protein